MEESNKESRSDTVESPKNKGGNWVVPGAIVIAGLIIAGAVVFSNGGLPTNISQNNQDNTQETAQEETSIEPRPITENDHIWGNPDAEVVIIEYSDTECPFCKRFHATLLQVVEEYGGKDNGQVAWVYRHFPIPQLHSKAELEARATECAADLGGNDGFWEFTNRLYKETPSNDGLDLALLPQFAEDADLDRVQFEACLESDQFDKRIFDDRSEAVATGGRGTPHSLILVDGKVVTSISGAQPFENIKTVIDQILEQK